MKKSFFFLTSLFASSTALAQNVAKETVEHMPENWFPIATEVRTNDAADLVGMPYDTSLAMTYSPDTVSTGYLGFLQSSAGIANWVFASVVIVAIIFAIFMLINGRAKLVNGFSGKLIRRWSIGDVALHWLVAIPGVILILTGLVIGSGWKWLMPLMGADTWGSFIKGCTMFHNFFAIFFAIGGIILMIKWMSRQIPASYDLKWFARLGGYINSGNKIHPDAGFANAGEKAFYWCFVIFGLLLISTGLLMLWPDYFSLSKSQQLGAIVLHIVSAVVLSAFSVVHIFMGSVMSEGSIENMLSGKCDENWAKQNHNLWYAKVSSTLK
jgi:formate dehydrogenase subunit gamma